MLGVAPNLDLTLQVMELATGLEVQAFVFLHWNQGDRQEVGSAGNVALELDQNGLLRLEVSFDSFTCHRDLLVFVPDNKWSHHSMFRSPDRKRRPPRHHKINIIELFPAADHSRHQPLSMQLLQSVIWLPLSNRIKVNFLSGHRAFPHVLFPHLLRQKLGLVGQLRIHVVSMRVLHFG